MAGKRHHHVWQMLQRGFAQPAHGDDHVWVYRKNELPKRTITKKYGEESYYYGAEDSAADRNITDFENSVQGVIQDARNSADGEELDSEVIAPIIAHLEVRSNFLRAEFSRIYERMLKVLECYFCTEKRSRDLFSAYMKNHPEILDEALDEACIDGEKRVIAELMAIQELPEAIRSASSELAKMRGELFAPILENMAETVKRAHNKSLEESFDATERSKAHQGLQYFIFRTKSEKLVLPDTCLAFLTRRGCSPVIMNGEKVECAILPISSQVAIIGKSNNAINRNVRTINKALSSCAFDSFLAEEKSEIFQRLSPRISSNARLITEAELKKILSFRELSNL